MSMDTFRELNILVFAVIACCAFFLSSAPKLPRYGVLVYGVGMAIHAMAFEGMAPRLLESACTLVGSTLIVIWAYRVTNRPRQPVRPIVDFPSSPEAR